MSDTRSNDLWRSEFVVRKMDCAAEQQLVKAAFSDNPQVYHMDFDLPSRRVVLLHSAYPESIHAIMRNLQLDAERLALSEGSEADLESLAASRSASDRDEARTLRWLLGINLLMFLVEIVGGIWAQSAGLIADSLDMLADASVYTIALIAVGRSAGLKLTAARATGWLQLVLGLGVLLEVSRRFIYGSEPESLFMIGIGAIALAANIFCLYLLSKKKNSGVHMTATWICSSNDVIANAGVILAGLLVLVTGSPYPDLVIGLVITTVVLNGARRILSLKA